ncbi:MAG: leucine-rich repeat domain-containing protein, partial [Oscillospiraceae bacterium]|nr:leucine-rich repeat domain-containing protein [Oscillospiraceae bacterium]
MNTKKLLAILLALVMLIGMMPVTALAADATSGKCGENATWSYDTASGTLTISGTGPMNDTNAFYMPWRDYSEDMKTLVIEDGITRIGAKCFTGCSFTEVSIPDSVIEIGANAFAECVNLKTVDLPDITTIEAYSFYRCENLESIHIPETVTSIKEGAIFGCKSLTELNIPAAVENIELYGTLAGLESITAYNVDPANEHYSSDENGILYNKEKSYLIRLPGSYAGDYVMPDSITFLHYDAFRNCNKLTNVTVNANIKYADQLDFSVCPALEGIWFDAENPSFSSDSKGAMFNKDYTKLMAVPVMLAADYEIPDSVTIIGNRAFVGSTITELVIPEGVTELEIGAFSNCPNLKQVTLPESLEKIGQTVFNNCLGVTDIYYNGTAEQWEAITIGNYNDTLSDATIHFKGETTPTPEPTPTPTPEPTPEVKPGINGTIGTNCTWNFNEGVLTISGEGKMGGYMLNQKKENTDAPWFGGGNGVNAGYGDFSSDIHEIVVEEGITG